MKLSRKWLQEFVDVGPVSDRDFAEAMTISGSKVEVTEDLGAEIQNVVAGRIKDLERHPSRRQNHHPGQAAGRAVRRHDVRPP